MDLVEVGYVARAHGVRGELRVVCHNPASTALLEVSRLIVDGTAYDVEQVRQVKDGFLVKLAGVRDRNQAEAMRGRQVSAERTELVEDDELLLADLVGITVTLPDGSPWGEVVGVELGPQDRLVIHHGDVERLLPIVDEYIRDLDLEAGRMVVDPPEGWPESKAR